MSLKPIDRSKIPEKIVKLGRKLLGEDNIYRVIGDRFTASIKDEDFVDMYSPIGGAAELRDLENVRTLPTVWEQQFEWDEVGEYTGPREKLDAHGLIQSPHEPEARYRKKRDKSWQGYVAQVTETAEEAGDPNFITDVEATDAQVSDNNALPGIQDRLAERDLIPSEQYVDQAYVSGTRLAESAERDISLIGPVANEAGPKEFKLSDFTVDLERKEATCPEGKRAVRWTTSRRPDGTLDHTAHFDEQCAGCPSRSRCTEAKAGRTITTHEHHDQVVRRRAEMETAAFWKAMKHRPPVEGTISQLARQGMRHARYLRAQT